MGTNFWVLWSFCEEDSVLSVPRWNFQLQLPWSTAGLIHYKKICRIKMAMNVSEGRDLDRFERLAHVNIMKFRKESSAASGLGQSQILNTGWVRSILRAALQRRTWVYWWMKSLMWAVVVHFQSWKPTVRSSQQLVKVVLPLYSSPEKYPTTAYKIAVLFAILFTVNYHLFSSPFFLHSFL